LTPAAPPSRLLSRRTTRVSASRRTQLHQPVPLTKPPARRQQPPPLGAYRAPGGAAVATCAACLARPRHGVGCHVTIGANGATLTATRAASRFAAAGFPPGAAAAAFPPPLPACGGADAAGDRGRRVWPVAAMQPALVASPGAHDTPESPCLGIAAPPSPLFSGAADSPGGGTVWGGTLCLRRVAFFACPLTTSYRRRRPSIFGRVRRRAASALARRRALAAAANHLRQCHQRMRAGSPAPSSGWCRPDRRARRERQCHPCPAAAGRFGCRRHAAGATGRCVAASSAEASTRWGSHRPQRHEATRRRCSRPRRSSRPHGTGVGPLARPSTRLLGSGAPEGREGRGRSGGAMRRRFAVADVGRLATADH